MASSTSAFLLAPIAATRFPNPNPMFSSFPRLPPKPLTLILLKPTRLSVRTSTPAAPPLLPPPILSSFLSFSTRMATSLLAVSLSFLRSLRLPPTPSELADIASLRANLGRAATTPLFFAKMISYLPKDPDAGISSRISTPLSVLAKGMSKWIELYASILMVRVLLSWFPNVPWERQPLSAMRDLCDPYLNLFRNIIPPVFDTLDVSPLLAFAVLGILGGVLYSAV